MGSGRCHLLHPLPSVCYPGEELSVLFQIKESHKLKRLLNWSFSVLDEVLVCCILTAAFYLNSYSVILVIKSRLGENKWQKDT